MAGRSGASNFKVPHVTHRRTNSQAEKKPEMSKKALTVERNKYEGLAERPESVITIPSDDPDNEELVIKNGKCIGSYSWTFASWDMPTILVPGLPRKLDMSGLPYKVPSPDEGIHIIDQNGIRTTKGKIGYFVPLVASVSQYRKIRGEAPFDWAAVDIVADRAALRKLSRWANAKLSVQPKNFESHTNFRLDLQLAGEKTLLMNRRSLRFAEFHLRNTYRKGFNKGFLPYPAGSKDILDYYRIMNYEMHGLNMVVRFEVDAYESTNGSSNEELDNLAASLSLSSLGSPTTSKIHGLTIQQLGQVFPESSTLTELSTRSIKNVGRFPMDLTEIYSQLFLSQTTKCVLVRHEEGLFTDFKTWLLTDQELNNVKEQGQKQMKKLCNLLTFIRELVIPHGNESRFSLVCDHGVLKLYKRTRQESSLPDELLGLFCSGAADAY